MRLGVTFIAPKTGTSRSGTAKDDTLLGFTGPDVLFGLAGDDTIWGDYSIGDSTAHDILFGGPRDDTIFAVARRRTTIRCGPGFDTVQFARKDKVAKDCEKLVPRR